MSEDRKSKKAGGAWNKNSRTSGQPFISGQITIGNRIYNFTLLPNSYKEHDRQPDWNVMLQDDA